MGTAKPPKTCRKPVVTTVRSSNPSPQPPRRQQADTPSAGRPGTQQSRNKAIPTRQKSQKPCRQGSPGPFAQVAEIQKTDRSQPPGKAPQQTAQRRYPASSQQPPPERAGNAGLFINEGADVSVYADLSALGLVTPVTVRFFRSFKVSLWGRIGFSVIENPPCP